MIHPIRAGRSVWWSFAVTRSRRFRRVAGDSSRRRSISFAIRSVRRNPAAPRREASGSIPGWPFAACRRPSPRRAAPEARTVSSVFRRRGRLRFGHLARGNLGPQLVRFMGDEIPGIHAPQPAGRVAFDRVSRLEEMEQRLASNTFPVDSIGVPGAQLHACLPQRDGKRKRGERPVDPTILRGAPGALRTPTLAPLAGVSDRLRIARHWSAAARGSS